MLTKFKVTDYKSLSEAYKGWKYTPENTGESLNIWDILDLCDGNFKYADLVASRVEWQHPATLIDEDQCEGEEIPGAPTIVVYIIGGCLQWVSNNIPGLRIGVLDGDTENSDGSDGVHTIVFSDGPEEVYCYHGDVNEFNPEYAEDLFNQIFKAKENG